jgi:hypothetical protein
VLTPKQKTINDMGFLKGLIVGAVAYGAVQYLSKKDLLTGRSKMEELIDKAPEYLENVKKYVTDVEQEFIEAEVRV